MLPALCPTCHATVQPGDRFCGECGAPLSPPAATPAPTKSVSPEVWRFEGHDQPILAVAFSPSGREVLSAGKDAWIRCCDVESGDELRRLNMGAADMAAFASGGTHAISGSGLGTITLWQLSDGRRVRQIDTKEPVAALAISHDGRRALCSGRDNGIRLWDLESGRELRRMQGHQSEPACSAFSSDATRAVSGATEVDYSNSAVLVWDVASGRELTRPSRPMMLVSSVAFSPDGRRAVAGSMDGSITVWDVASGKQLLHADGHAGNVLAVALSSDGTCVASGSGTDYYDDELRRTVGVDNTVRVWDVGTGRELHRSEGHTRNVTCVAFAADGRLAASGSADATVRLWRC